MDIIEATMDCFALFFQLSVMKVANYPLSFTFNLSSTFAASWSRIGPDKVCQSGTTALGIHFWTKICICGLFAEFHGAWIAIRSLHMSSPNSDWVAGVHTTGLVPTERGESSKVLDVHLCLKFVKEVDSNRGLRSGDGAAEIDVPSHLVGLSVCGCKEY
jgi:hypothetical protein